MWGRESKQIRLEVCLGARINQIQPLINARTQKGCLVNTDQSGAYNRVSSNQRKHKTVNHGIGEFARDEDGDGFYEVHCNSCEGLWTGVRNFLRKFRGVSKKYLAQYIAIFENNFNRKNHVHNLCRAMLIPDFYLENY